MIAIRFPNQEPPRGEDSFTPQPGWNPSGNNDYFRPQEGPQQSGGAVPQAGAPFFRQAARGDAPHPAAPPLGNADPDYFSPVQPKQGMQGPPVPDSKVPPPYQGELFSPVTQQQGPPFMQGPAFGVQPTQLPPDQSPPPPGSMAPDRVPYRAPPRKRSMMLYLYLSLGILVTVLAIMGISQLIAPGQNMTALVTLSGQDSTYSGAGLIVRNESVFSQAGVSTIRYTAEEGANVQRGTAICTVYTTGFSNRELTTLQNHRANLKEHQQLLLTSETVPDTRLQRLDSVVMERAAETQALIRGANGNLLNQETLMREAVSERQSYIKQKYPDDTKLTRLYDNENNQLQRIDTWTKQYSATDDGIVSFYTDGFEGALNTTNYMTYTPQQVRLMLEGDVPEMYARGEETQDIFRLVRQHDWSVLMLADDTDWTPVVNDTYQMLIESFESTTVTAKVESVTKSGGELLVRMTVGGDVRPMLYARSLRLQLSKSTITYAVPANALINQGGMIGVVVIFAEGDYLIPVNVVSQDATQANIIPVNAGYLYEGMSVRLFGK